MKRKRPGFIKINEFDFPGALIIVSPQSRPAGADVPNFSGGNYFGTGRE
jgi:hypothetical protein